MVTLVDFFALHHAVVANAHPKSGDSAVIPLVEAGEQLDIRDRWKVVDKMEMITQYTFAGDFTGAYKLTFVAIW